MLEKDQINKIINFAREHPEISLIYLFGSHALGHPRSRSDIDLGILFIMDVDGFTRINMETEISNLLEKDVDLIDTRKSSPFLRHQIYKYGKIIYHDGSYFPFQFRASSIRDYLDTNYDELVKSLLTCHCEEQSLPATCPPSAALQALAGGSASPSGEAGGRRSNLVNTTSCIV